MVRQWHFEEDERDVAVAYIFALTVDIECYSKYYCSIPFAKFNSCSDIWGLLPQLFRSIIECHDGIHMPHCGFITLFGRLLEGFNFTLLF